ncbi:MAG: NADPH-dependent 7-cyano-7-deazaguanine reductase QueF [Pseudomonadota bacterium]
MTTNPLGLPTSYPSRYAPELLFAIPRTINRNNLGFDAEKLPFLGFDVWRAYEISWLNLRGKPVVAIGEFVVPCDSPNIVESKSLKLYLNSLNQTQFFDIAAVKKLLTDDLSRVAGSTIAVRLFPANHYDELKVTLPLGRCLDDLDIQVNCYTPTPQHLKVDANCIISETLYSELFRSNCPVTGQPDWGTIVISYHGPAIDHRGLLAYLVSFRAHEGFHEDCVEHVFRDISTNCATESLQVSINFLRRGGLEINPIRFSNTYPSSLPSLERFVRQ